MSAKIPLGALFLALIAVSLAWCGGKKKVLTVSEVWRDAASLDGERIRVRGQADFRLIPYHPLQVGGCVVGEDRDKFQISGRLALLDQDSQDPERGLFISESSLHCEGDMCKVVCSPFAPTAHATWGGSETIEAFEFAGTLRVDDQGGTLVLILEDIDLQASQRLFEGKWGPIPTGDFTYLFP